MRILIKPKYLYLLLPLTFVYVCVFAAINYALCKDIRMAVKTLLIAFVGGGIFIIFIPEVVFPVMGIVDIFETGFSLVYLYFVSTVTSLYVIKEQKDYYEKTEGERQVKSLFSSNAAYCQRFTCGHEVLRMR